MLNRSPSPSILLVSSLAAVIPAPTRSLYASTKAASLTLYQSMSIEHPNITFTVVIPSTVEGDLRSKALDADVVASAPLLGHGSRNHPLKRDDVAKRCIQAVDSGEHTVFMPSAYRWVHLLYWLWPSIVERGARKRYNYTAPST